MTNTILTSTAVTREALRVLHQKLNFVGSITRDYDDSFAKKGAKIGDTLKIRVPNQYTVRTGATMSVQNTAESSVDLTVATEKGVDLQFSDTDLAMSLDNFSDRVLEPAMAALAAHIEADALSMYKDVYQQVNNTGSAATTAKLAQTRKVLVDALAPANKRALLLNTQDNADLVEAMKGLFQREETIAEQFRDGKVGRTQGYGDVYENTHLTGHTRGAQDTAYTTDTRTSALATDGTAYSSLTVASGTGAGKKGDVFTIGNVFRVHPETKVSTGVAQQFALTADYVGGAGSISITPSIILGGAKQTVTIPTTSATAAISWAGTASATHGISLAYQQGAFAFATADLEVPKGMDMAAREVYDGISMRFVRGFDILNGRFLCRLDVLYGYKTIRPQLACRMANN